MNRIRPLRPEDTEDVARLYEDVVWSGDRESHDGVVTWLGELLDHPWADEEIPSLVATGTGGEIVGFLASHVRRLCVDGEPRRLGCSGHLVVAEQARGRATGAMLTATYLRGPQDLSITDGATNDMAQIWEGLGGDTAPLQQLTWIRPVAPWKHPLRFTEAVVDRARQRRPAAVRAGTLPPLAAADAAGVQVAPLTPAALLATLRQITPRLRLHPAYDEPFASWLLGQLARSDAGALRAAQVAGPDGTPLGYYAYYARPGGPSPVVCVAGATAQTTEVVLQAVLADARACGVAVLLGRVEPRLTGALRRSRAVVPGVLGSQALVHSRDPALLYLATSRHALLTRMEGEWGLMPPSPGASRSPGRTATGPTLVREPAPTVPTTG